MRFDRLWRDVRLATMRPEHPGLGVVDHGAIATLDGQIAFAGREADLPIGVDAQLVFRMDGRWVTPGLIDCHTHLVFAGDRSDEFEARLSGDSYGAISARGGGIAATVRATRKASEADLLRSALSRLDALMAGGVTTIEVKSGYGLEEESELRLLRVARSLAQHRAVSVSSTYLGAHAVPPGGDRRSYLAEIIGSTLPRIAELGLADAVDAFCEGIAFDLDETEAVFRAASSLGLPVKLHAEQLSRSGGALLAARFGARSADHLEYADAEDAAALAGAGTVAVLLPGAYHQLREPVAPPVQAFRSAGVQMAVATDCNPGTSPLLSLPLAMNFACVRFGLSVEEAWVGVTRHAAQALGLLDRGVLAPGRRADLAVWEFDRPAELIAWMGPPPLHARIVAGG